MIFFNYFLFYDMDFFFFFRKFQPMVSTLDDNSLSSNQDTNQFWCKRELNPRSLIQSSETLPVEITETHDI